MFCFPIADQVMVAHRKVSFSPMHVYMYAKLKTKGKFPVEYHVVWIVQFRIKNYRWI